MHVPVMCAEVVELLSPRDGGVFVDCTVGPGGHARALLEAGATRVVGLDRDAEVLVQAREALSPWADKVDLAHADYRSLAAILDARGLAVVDGMLADLGVSSSQFDGVGRGFSFQRDEPLDMRMDRSTGLTAAELVASSDQAELADIIFRYGEERHSRRVARAIVEARRREPIRTTGQLAAIVRRAIPRLPHRRIDPATRTFQALRIRVNQELEGLDRFLGEACRRLRAGGRLVVISFHSLEDRIVKRTFRALESDDTYPLRALTRKPRQPAEDEVRRNPRARSAKLRAVERLAQGRANEGGGGR
jgi:16S rRNA (cytosine1402-N4)-methyltransferase